MTKKRLIAAGIGAFLFIGGLGGAWALGETTNTVAVCATATATGTTTPAHTVAVDGTDVKTVPGSTIADNVVTNCATTTYTVSTVTTTAPAPTTTTGTTTTTPPPPTGTTLYTGDFETGNISQWNWGGQCSNTGTQSDSSYARGTINVSSAYAVQGNYGARVVIPTDSKLPQACEVLEHRPLVVDTYYSLAFRFGTANTNNAWGTTLAQFNYQGIWGPPEGLFAENSTTTSEATPNSVLMVLQSGLCSPVNSPSPGCNYVGSRYDEKNLPARQYLIPPGQLTLGTWYETICHIHFATDASGVYECWYRILGTMTWVVAGRYSNVPTVQWTSTPKLPSEDVSKIGAYRPADTTSQWTVDLDGFTAATTFERAAANLP